MELLKISLDPSKEIQDIILNYPAKIMNRPIIMNEKPIGFISDYDIDNNEIVGYIYLDKVGFELSTNLDDIYSMNISIKGDKK